MILIGRGLDLGEEGTGRREKGTGKAEAGAKAKAGGRAGTQPETWPGTICEKRKRRLSQGRSENVRGKRKQTWSVSGRDPNLCGFEGARQGKRRRSESREARSGADRLDNPIFPVTIA